MTTTDVQRLHLLESARSTWDEDAANTLIASLPPAVDDLATRTDLDVLGASLRAELRTEMSELRTEMADRFAEQTRAIADLQRVLLVAMVTMVISALGLAFAAAHFA